MFLSRLNDLVEARGHTVLGSRIFKRINLSYQKVEILSPAVDLSFFLLAASRFSICFAR